MDNDDDMTAEDAERARDIRERVRRRYRLETNEPLDDQHKEDERERKDV